jgi:Ca2+-binding RTX toxin-like protein
MTMKQATFDTGAEGWTFIGGTGGHDATGGVDGSGALTGQDNASGDWAFAASADWLGDLSAYYGATLSFQQRQKVLTGQLPDTAPDVILRGNGLVLVANVGAPPGIDWTDYSVNLSLGQGWKIGSLTGRIATEAEIRAVLADLTALEIRGDYVSGLTDDIGWLDNVVLSDPAPVPPVPVGWQIAETFDTGLGGWSFVADVAEFRWKPDGGNTGGYAEAVDFATGEVWYFVAPGAFLGNRKGFYGGELAFDLKQSPVTNQFNSADVVLTGAGMTLVFDTPNNPGTDWTGYSINLTDSAGWKVGGLTGAAATRANMLAVLGNLESLHIRGEFVSGNDTGGLDNVSLTAAPRKIYVLSDPVDQVLERGFGNMQAALDFARYGRLVEVLSDTGIGAAPWTVASNRLTVHADAPLSGTFQLGDNVGRFTLSGANDASATVTRAGSAQVQGSDGSNLLLGGTGNDTLLGGSGSDTLLGGFGHDVLRGEDGRDRLEGGDGSDTLNGQGGNDTLLGQNGADLLDGGAGNDVLDGGANADVLKGGHGNDTLRGGAGNDTLTGGAGNDQLTGGTGADVFVFGLGDGTDRIIGFDPVADRLLLDATLWGDTTTDPATVVAQFAAVSGPDTVFTFAGGEQIILQGFAHPFLLAGVIDLF